ncbi:MAG TPA: hypothetical protein VNQ73_12920 [Ilumatobacter sp.]|nr:hypothetical protein [Ilumatobacter sp.]
MTVSPASPGGSPWKPAALGFGAAAVVGAGIFGIVKLTGGDDDQVATDNAAVPTITVPAITVPAELQDAIDNATAEAEAAAADARSQAEDVLGGVLSSIPTVPEQGHSDSAVSPTVPGTAVTQTESGGGVTITIPDDLMLGGLTECLGLGDLLGGLDLGQLGQLDLGEFGEFGDLPSMSLPDFENMTPEELANLDVNELLEQVLGQLGEGMPGGLPFDFSFLDELDLGTLGEAGSMSPEELQEMIESQLGDLGTLTSLPPMSFPDIPSFDPAQLEECFADLAP